MEADVALLHIAGGGTRVSPPPGTLAQTPPRRAARGRGEDFLFLSACLDRSSLASPGLLDQLVHVAAEAFFNTPGSVTAALREAAAAANDHLLGVNRGSTDAARGRLLLAVLRGPDLYLAQCGEGQAALIRPNQVSRFSSSEASARPLGVSLSPYLSFFHVEARPSDLVILTSGPTPAWPDAALVALAGQGPDRAIERLAAATSQDLTGLVVRMTAAGQGAAAEMPAAARRAAASSRATAGQPGDASPAAVRPAGARPAPQARLRPTRSRSPFAGLTAQFAPLTRRIDRAWLVAKDASVRLLNRLAPGLESSRPGSFPPALLAGTAIAIPLIVVAVATVVYLRRGRTEEFRSFLLQAQASVVAAELQKDDAQARPMWEQARIMLDQAAKYGRNGDWETLDQQVQESLDKIDLIVHLDFRPVVNGGFGSGTRISAIAASTTDLYVLDSSHARLWHAWATGRGYEIDRNFECLEGASDLPDLSTPVDLAVQKEPGALGREGVVVVDTNGTLVYCAPDSVPTASQLTPPENGFRQIRAIDVFNDRLYVLDPPANAIWVYDAADGLFSGQPSYYFVDSAPDILEATDLAGTQDDLFLLLRSGQLDRCKRGKCDSSLVFEDDRPGSAPGDRIPGGSPMSLDYAPPPEPSLYFLDSTGKGVFQYSMRLVYQALYKPLEAFSDEPSAFTIGPPNDLFVAAGSQVYYAQPQR